MTEMKKKHRPPSAGTVALNAPYVLWAAAFIVIPLLFVLYYAFTDADGSFTFANLSTIVEYKNEFIISVVYSVIATAVCLLLAYPMSYFMSCAKPSSQWIMVMLAMLPMWMNMLIRTYSWTTILESNGIINSFLESIGIGKVTMMGTPGAVILGMVYNYLPYMILPIYTGMSKIDRSLYEAAEDLGCGAFQKFRRVTLPLSLPGVISGITMVFVPSISTFYISYKMGGGKIKLIGDIIEMEIKERNNTNAGAALSLVLMLFIFASLAVMNRFSDDEEGGIVL